MTQLKILKLVKKCGECPHHHYNSGGTYLCNETGQLVHNKESLPAFCPLADFPARKLADLEHTLRVQNQLEQSNFLIQTLSFIARKLNVPLGNNHSFITIPYGNKDEVAVLGWHCITEFNVSHGLDVSFMHDNKKFRLRVEGRKPELEEWISKEIDGKTIDGWTDHPIRSL